MFKRITILCFLLTAATTGLTAQPEPISRMSTLVEQYEADLESLDRAYVLKESPAYFTRMEQLYKQWQSRLEEVDYGDLTSSEGIDYILMKRNIGRGLKELEAARKSYEKVRSAARFADIVSELQGKRKIGQDLEGKQFAMRLDELAGAIQDNWESVKESGRMAPGDARRAAGIVENLRETLEHVYTFYYGYDPDVTWWAETPYAVADSLFSEYAEFLVGWTTDQSARDDGSGIVGNPVGEEALQELLAYEMIPYTPDELIRLAEKEYAWCLEEMLKASRELGYGDDWHAALEHVKNSYVPPGKQPAMIHRLAVEATEFIEERDLLTVPELAKEDWGMRMMSPERQLINPFFTGGRNITISYPTNTMDHDDKMMSMRGNNPHFSKATVHHELIAGHHLQGFMTRRHKSYRRAFRTPFWGEGWALYWELKLYDIGFPESPEDRIGMLFWRMHRCARIIFSLGFHMGHMTPQECIDFLVEKVGHEYANAEAEVRRSFTTYYPPLYQAAYLLGGLQLRSLYRELVTNGDMTAKAFHDNVLKNGSMPIEMVRLELKNEKPPKDFGTSWRFYPSLD